MPVPTLFTAATRKKYSVPFVKSETNPKVSVEIQFVKNLLKKEEIYGDAEWLDFERRPKEFTIRVDGSQPLRRMLETVAHEMVHVRQILTNGICDEVEATRLEKTLKTLAKTL